MTGPRIRPATTADLPALAALYPASFPDEDLLPLVRDLAREPAVLSLVADEAGRVIGHAMFTTCAVTGAPERVALLGPLAVTPDRQRRGLGRALVERGFDRLRAAGVAAALVLGDPGYYGRLGFAPETGILPPYDLPPEWAGAWQSQRLRPGPPASGRLAPPAPWMRRALWTP